MTLKVNVIDPENIEFFDNLAKLEFQQKEVNADFRKKEEVKIDEQVKKKEEQIKQLESLIDSFKEEISSLEKVKDSLKDKTFFDDKYPKQQEKQIAYEIERTKLNNFPFPWDERFDLQSQVYEQIKDNVWLDFETTKELFYDSIPDDDCSAPLSEVEKWFYKQTYPDNLKLNVTSSLLDYFKSDVRVKECDTLEEFLEKREESLAKKLDSELKHFYLKMSFYLACKKYYSELSKEISVFELEFGQRVCYLEKKFEEQYLKEKGA